MLCFVFCGLYRKLFCDGKCGCVSLLLFVPVDDHVRVHDCVRCAVEGFPRLVLVEDGYDHVVGDHLVSGGDAGVDELLSLVVDMFGDHGVMIVTMLVLIPKALACL